MVAGIAGALPIVFWMIAPVWAQDNEPADDEALEEIIVTGTHIEGVSEEALPVTVFSADEIRDIGAPSMFDLQQ